MGNRRYQDRKSKGVCVTCGESPARPNMVCCVTCAEKNRDRRRELVRKRRGTGKCLRCGKPVKPKCSYCSDCIDRSSSRRKKSIKKLKQRSIEYKGGKCEDCGLITPFLSVYEFHHLDPSCKEDSIKIRIQKTTAWENVKHEINKCVMLCANCHRIRHEKGELL